MNRGQYSLLAVLVAVSSLLGGALSGEFFAGTRLVAGEMRAEDAQASGPKNVVRAKRIEVLDKQGRLRAVFGMAKEDKPGIALYDKSGGVSFVVGVDADGRASLSVQGKGGSNVALTVWPNGSTGLILHDNKGKVRGVLRISEKGSPVLGFDDENGKTRLILGEFAPDIATGSLPKTTISSLTLLDKNEKVIWKAPQ